MATINDTNVQSTATRNSKSIKGGTHQNDMFLSDAAIVARALQILESTVKYSVDVTMNTPTVVRDFCRLKLGALPHEVFAVLWLDTQNRVIEYEEMFRGTLSQASVYPREVAKSALAHNASAVILVHNHPSGVATPSKADINLTETLKTALALFDVRVLDHIIVTATATVSLAEKGFV